MQKSTTTRIAITDPDDEQLESLLQTRKITPGLSGFLTELLRAKKWARKINIPSGHDDVAAVLVFTTKLKDEGLEIFSELHVYFAGKTLVEKWEVAGESEEIGSLPKEALSAIDITKVRVEGSCVAVEFNVPMPEGQGRTLVETFDFTAEGPACRIIPHPLIRSGPAPSPL